jgi:acetyl esterase/lipase
MRSLEKLRASRARFDRVFGVRPAGFSGARFACSRSGERVRGSWAAATVALLLAGAPVLADGPERALPPGITVERDVVYARAAERPLTLDVYRPEHAAGPSPVLLFFHGGGWVMGSKHDALPEVYAGPAYGGDRRWPSMLPYLERGLAVVSLDYRLAAEATAPAAVEDCRRGLEWIATRGAEHGLDAARVVTIGASAGGHLALMVAFGPGHVLGAIDLYGITDVAPLLAPPTERSWATEWIGSAPGREARARSVSPLSLVRPGLPPVLIVHSDVDDVVPYAQAERLAHALEAAGVQVELITFPGAAHGFFTPAERERLDATVTRFLGRLGLLADGRGTSAGSRDEPGHGERERAR